MRVLKGGGESVQAQGAPGPLAAVATDAGGLEKGENIRVKGDALIGRNGRKFGEIKFGDVPVVLRWILGGGRKFGQQQRENS